MKVVFTDRAKAGLRSIALAIARDSPGRARSFIRELRGSARKVGDNPRAYPVVEGFERQEIRRHVHGNYLIFYRIEANVVVILHILHGARDYAPLLDALGARDS